MLTVYQRDAYLHCSVKNIQAIFDKIHTMGYYYRMSELSTRRKFLKALTTIGVSTILEGCWSGIPSAPTEQTGQNISSVKDVERLVLEGLDKLTEDDLNELIKNIASQSILLFDRNSQTEQSALACNGVLIPDFNDLVIATMTSCTADRALEAYILGDQQGLIQTNSRFTLPNNGSPITLMINSSAKTENARPTAQTKLAIGDPLVMTSIQLGPDTILTHNMLFGVYGGEDKIPGCYKILFVNKMGSFNDSTLGSGIFTLDRNPALAGVIGDYRKHRFEDGSIGLEGIVVPTASITSLNQQRRNLTAEKS